MANANFTWKGNLEEANTIKRALDRYRGELMQELTNESWSSEEEQGMREEIGRADALLRRDFP